jgi:LPXTG-site transpeptidase (sortase) family protein
VGVPQSENKTWDVSWLGNSTGWLNGTAFPTWNGNSVLTAHVTNANGLDGPFAALKTLKYGDQVIVHMGGAKYVYEVRETKLARPYSTSYAFQSKQDAAYLTLITCQFYNPLSENYLFRRVVRAVLVEVSNK